MILDIGYKFSLLSEGSILGSRIHIRCIRRLSRVQGSGHTIQSSGFRAGFRVQGSGFRVQGPRSRVQGSGSRVQGSGFRVQGSGFRVQGSGFRVRELFSSYDYRVYGLGGRART
jgi:hypothetical protein